MNKQKKENPIVTTENGKAHLRKCETCKKAKMSDQMCEAMQKFLDGGNKTYTREALVLPVRALFLDAEYRENLKRPCSDKFRAFFKKFNLHGLTYGQKQYIKLYFHEGLTEEEIAEKLHKTQQSVNQKIKRGINKLNKKYYRNPLLPVQLWEEKNENESQEKPSPNTSSEFLNI